MLILSSDVLILFELSEVNLNLGTVVFYSSLYAIIDVLINKQKKIVKVTFSKTEYSNDLILKLKIENVLYFREILLQRMDNLKILSELKNNCCNGILSKKRLLSKDIKDMKTESIIKNVHELTDSIKAGDKSFYNIHTFTELCTKVIEHYSKLDNNLYVKYLDLLKTIVSNK